MYFVLLSFITNPLLTAASLICVTTFSSVTRQSSKYQHIICIHYVLSLFVKNCSIPIGLWFLITFPNTKLDSVADSASTCLQAMAKCFDQLALDFHFSFSILHIITLLLVDIYICLYICRTYCKYHYDSEHEFSSPEAEFRHFLVRTGNPNWKWLSKRSVTPPEHAEQCK
jgi:Ca2+/Na+ antiporter